MLTKGFYAAEHKWEIILQSTTERNDWVKKQIQAGRQPMSKFKEEAAELKDIISQIKRTLAMFDE